MVLYIDVYFLENFIFDFLVVLLAQRLAGARIRLLRCALAALVGAAYAIAAALNPEFGSLFFKISALALMVFAASSVRSVKAFLKAFVIFFLTFSASGGAAYALALSCGGSAFPGCVYFDAPVFASLSGIGIIAVTGVIAGSKIRRGRSDLVSISVLKGGRVFQLSALCDSGNRATDPVTGLDIIVAEDIFPEDIRASARKMRTLTASGEGELLVFIPDRLVVKDARALFTHDAAIGITDKRLSEDNSFNALIGGAFFERAESYSGAFEEHIK